MPAAACSQPLCERHRGSGAPAANPHRARHTRRFGPRAGLPQEKPKPLWKPPVGAAPPPRIRTAFAAPEDSARGRASHRKSRCGSLPWDRHPAANPHRARRTRRFGPRAGLPQAQEKPLWKPPVGSAPRRESAPRPPHPKIRPEGGPPTGKAAVEASRGSGAPATNPHRARRSRRFGPRAGLPQEKPLWKPPVGSAPPPRIRTAFAAPEDSARGRASHRHRKSRCGSLPWERRPRRKFGPRSPHPKIRPEGGPPTGKAAVEAPRGSGAPAANPHRTAPHQHPVVLRSAAT